MLVDSRLFCLFFDRLKKPYAGNNGYGFFKLFAGCCLLNFKKP